MDTNNPDTIVTAADTTAIATSATAAVTTAAATEEPTIEAPTKSSKKRNRENPTATPAALQSSLTQIHTTLATSFPPNAHLPSFQSIIHTYLTSKSANLPQLIVKNIIPQITTLCQKSLADIPPYVHLSSKDSAPQLKIDAEKLTVKGGMRGYRMVRGSQGVEAGNWYYEVEVLDPPSVEDVVKALPNNVRLGDGVREGLKKGLEKEQEEKKIRVIHEMEELEKEKEKEQDQEQEQEQKRKKKKVASSKDGGVEQYSVGGHLRMGWSMRTGELQAPVGYDRWSYGIRDIHGSRIHNSKREDKWGGVGFQPGDVIGFAICLKDDGLNASTYDDSGNGTSTSRKNPNVVTSNHIRFFKNGAPMGHFIVSRGIKTGGEAFDDIQSGTYYPAISSYMGGTAKVNFGPHFIYPPKGLPTGMKLRPSSEMCPKPMDPNQVLELFKKEKCILKKVDDEITNAVHDAIFLEAKMRHDLFQQHLDDHAKVVRKRRIERGLGCHDLPDPAPEKMEIDDEIAPIGNGEKSVESNQEIKQ
eukprot:scaffold193_cov239-Chaetoceros_neogracile.AAC.3